MTENLKIYTYDPQFWKVLESYLRTNFPQAEIKTGKKKDRVVMKRSTREKLTIRFVGDPQQKTTRLSFHYMKWVVRGILYGRMGVWPTLVAQSESYGFTEKLASEMGRYLGTRYWTKAESIKPKGVQPDTFFAVGLLLLGCLFFLFCRCFDFAHSDDVWWFSGWCKQNVWVALLYSLAAWLVFFIIWNKKRSLPWLAYVLMPICCMAGWTLLSLGWNIDRLAGQGNTALLLGGVAVLILTLMGLVLYLLSGNQQKAPQEVNILFNP